MNDLTSQVVAGVRDLNAYQPGKPESELKRELGLEKIIKLASNENPLGCSKHVADAIQHALLTNIIATYPDNSGFSLKHKICQQLADKSTAINAQQITLGSGSNDLLDIIARVFADVESEVVFSQYAFAVYYISTKAVGAKPVIVPAIEYGHDLDAMLAAITDKTKIIFIANPNNPTGTWLSYRQLKDFVKEVPKHIIVVIDEAYTEYLDKSLPQHQDKIFQDFESLVNDIDKYQNLIITRTFSKAYGLASLRVGYAISNIEVADYLNRVRHPFNVNSMALIAAEAAIDDTDFIQQSVRLNAEQREFLYQAFDELELSYIPSAGNFISVNFADDALKINQFLLQKGIIVRDLQPYNMPEFLRISIGLAEQNAYLIDCLKEFYLKG